MSAGTLTAPAAPSLSWLPTPGVSVAAGRLHDWLECAAEEVRTTFSGGSAYRVARGSLDEAVGQAAEPNWDGYGALAANRSSFALAHRFLELLPSSFPAPDALVEPDGEIAFEWHYAPRYTFSVSIGPNGALTYSGLFGSAKSYGVEYLSYDEIPKSIRELLVRLFKEALGSRSTTAVGLGWG